MAAAPQNIDLSRWYPLKEVPEQIRLLNDTCRFRVVAAGRRSGKTERAKRHLAKQAMTATEGMFFAAAPTFDQVKRIFWDDLKSLTLSATHKRRPSESKLVIYLPGGAEIHLIGLDKPERIEGTPWVGGIIDEIADVNPVAWTSNIFPALMTHDPRRPDYKPWCWLIGVPDGLNHFYKMYNLAKSDDTGTWGAYQWASSEVLPEETIAMARENLSPALFRQEFEASFETASGRVYSDYTAENHTHEVIQPHEEIMWTHDQNFTPMSSAIGVKRDDDVYLLDEIVLESAVARQTAEEFIDRYAAHQNKRVRLYGDPHGRAGEKHAHSSDYTEIKQVLRSAGWGVTDKVERKAPPIRDRQNAVRARICSASGQRRLFVNPAKAKVVDEGFSTLQLKAGSAFQEDEKNRSQHITTAVGYMLHVEYPVLVHSRSGQTDISF